MIIGSLFSGCGGTALGFKRAGYEHAWFVENNKYAQKILGKNFPETTIYGDIKNIDFTKVQPIDILEGGFPCQDISNAGKRAGIKGDRSSLWKYYYKAIRILRPKYVVIENVSALTNRGLDVVLADLTTVGYDSEWHCISASAVGALHRRDRIFILAYPNNNGLFHGQTKKQPAEGREQTQSFTRSSCAEKQRYGWWSVEPGVGRVANGVPDRVDRIKCLGNAVVPQNAEVIAEALIIAEKENE